jgi:hypothetical protein
MAILATMRKSGLGEWPTLPDFFREARLRETSALGALATALTAGAEEQRELAESDGAGPVLLDLARDLRVPKGARLAATRCLVEGGIAGEPLSQLFNGAGDLVTDPRLGAAAKKLVELGLPASLSATGEAARVSFAAGAFARAAHSASSAVGQARVKELLAAAAPGHAGVNAALFALGGELPAGDREAWKKLLADTCVANRKAPAAARRMGLAPPWPPNLPETFAPLLKEAEEASSGVAALDAAAMMPVGRGPAGPVTAGRASLAPPPHPGRPPPTHTQARPPPSGAVPAAKGSSEVVGTRTMEAIKRSPFRKPIGTVVEGKTTLPPKPMEQILSRPSPGVEAPPAAPERMKLPDAESKPTKASPLPGLTPLPTKGDGGPKFDPLGRKIPRADRWRDDAFEWDEPLLPTPELPRPMKAAVAAGPFAQRLQSIFDDRPEAVDRLCAAAEARHALSGEEQLLRELSQELGRKRWEKARAPRTQLARLEAIRTQPAQPGPWRKVAEFLLDRLTPAERP